MDRRNVLKLAATGALAFYVDVGFLEPKEALAFVQRVAAPKAPLHIWYSECDFVIAETAEHAARLFREATGIPNKLRGLMHITTMLDEAAAFDAGDGSEAKDWQQWPDDKPFPFWEELEIPLDSRTLVLRDGEALRSQSKKCLIVRRGAGYDVYPFTRSRDVYSEPTPKPCVLFEVSKDELIYKKQSRKLPAEWIEEYKLGYFGSTEW